MLNIHCTLLLIAVAAAADVAWAAGWLAREWVRALGGGRHVEPAEVELRHLLNEHRGRHRSGVPVWIGPLPAAPRPSGQLRAA